MSKIDINNSMENSNPLFNYSNSMFNYSNPMLNNDISESETEEEFNIDEEDDFYELLNIKNGYKYEDLEGFEEIKKIIDYFDEENYFTEMKKNLNIKSFINGKTLKYDNIDSFSNQIDKNIKKYYNEPKDSYINVLMITEKPSIAYTISKIISKNKFIKHNHQTMNLYNFKGIFKGIKSFFTITSVKGHIYDNEYEEKFDDDNPEESYGYNIIKTVKNKKINIPKFLNYIAKDKDILCLWIDCDPEGENIC